MRLTLLGMSAILSGIASVFIAHWFIVFFLEDDEQPIGIHEHLNSTEVDKETDVSKRV